MTRYANPNSIAALISGRSIRDAVRAVLSDSERVRKTLASVEPRTFTDPFDQWLMGPRKAA